MLCRALQSITKQLDEQDSSISGQDPYSVIDAISMHRDIFYRDNDTSAGKGEPHKKMLTDLDTLVPKPTCEQVDRCVVEAVIGPKQRMGMGVGSNQLADQ